MDKKTFFYNTELFRKKLLIRTSIVVGMFVLFLAFNTYQLPVSERGKFLMIFAPLLLLLIWFLQKNYSKQIEILSKGRVEIEGGMLKQFDSYGSCAAIRIKDIERITHDKFRSYDRLVLETKEKVYPIVNMATFTEFKSYIESMSGKSSEVDSSEINYFSLRSFLFFLPSMIFVSLTFLTQISTIYPFFNQDTAMLFFNVNLIIFFLYLPEKKNYINVGFSFKRRMVFISMMVFFFQVYTNLKKSGFFEK